MTAVPLSALATAVEDIDAPWTERYLYPNESDLVRLSGAPASVANMSQHRHMEYLWGLEIFTIDPTHERSVLHSE